MEVAISIKDYPIQYVEIPFPPFEGMYLYVGRHGKVKIKEVAWCTFENQFYAEAE